LNLVEKRLFTSSDVYNASLVTYLSCDTGVQTCLLTLRQWTCPGGGSRVRGWRPGDTRTARRHIALGYRTRDLSRSTDCWTTFPLRPAPQRDFDPILGHGRWSPSKWSRQSV